MSTNEKIITAVLSVLAISVIIGMQYLKYI